MIRRMFDKLTPDVWKKIYVSLALSFVFAAFLGVITLSVLIFLAAFFSSNLICAVFWLLHFGGIAANKKIRIISALTAVFLVIGGVAGFLMTFDYDKGVSGFYSMKKKVETAEELSSMSAHFKNVSFTFDAGSFVKSDFTVEVIEQDGGEDGGTMEIIGRDVMYAYCLIDFDGKYFIVKADSKALSMLENASGDFEINGFVSVANESDMLTCSSIAGTVKEIIYPVDVFDGESTEDYYSDLEAMTAVDNVVIIFEGNNVDFTRLASSLAALTVVLGLTLLCYLILCSSDKEEKAEDK